MFAHITNQAWPVVSLVGNLMLLILLTVAIFSFSRRFRKLLEKQYMLEKETRVTRILHEILTCEPRKLLKLLHQLDTIFLVHGGNLEFFKIPLGEWLRKRRHLSYAYEAGLCIVNIEGTIGLLLAGKPSTLSSWDGRLMEVGFEKGIGEQALGKGVLNLTEILCSRMRTSLGIADATLADIGFHGNLLETTLRSIVAHVSNDRADRVAHLNHEIKELVAASGIELPLAEPTPIAVVAEQIPVPTEKAL